MWHKNPSGRKTSLGRVPHTSWENFLSFTLHLPLVCKFRPGLVPARLLVCLRQLQGQSLLATLHQIHKRRARGVSRPWPVAEGTGEGVDTLLGLLPTS